jgi:hypothetical protein
VSVIDGTGVEGDSVKEIIDEKVAVYRDIVGWLNR